MPTAFTILTYQKLIRSKPRSDGILSAYINTGFSRKFFKEKIEFTKSSQTLFILCGTV